MIIHKHPDGSEGYQYEVGDRVIVEATIGGGWFDIGPKGSDNCVVASIEPRATCWRTAIFEIKYSKDWGTVSCHEWGLKPHPETIENATIILVTD